MRRCKFFALVFLLTSCTLVDSSLQNGSQTEEPTNTSPVEQIFPVSPDQPVTQEPSNGVLLPPGNADVSENPYAPQPGDHMLSRGNVYLESTDLLILESYPVKVNLYLSGNLPTPCNQLRVVVPEADADNRIYIEAYSVIDPNAICIQVLEPFDTTISLGSFTSGHYEVYVNGELIGEFDS
jgi:hypothetical protein